jgi:biopolymer transport protein ExbD
MRKHRSDEEVELNLAAMLDMAFQLLAFFVLTFNPPQSEGQINLRLPPMQPLATNDPNQQKAGNNPDNKAPPVGLKTITITAFANPDGTLNSMMVNEKGFRGNDLKPVREHLQRIFSDPASPFEQVVLQIHEDLRYDDLMKVIDMCTNIKLANGHPLTKLSFEPLPNQPNQPKK